MSLRCHSGALKLNGLAIEAGGVDMGGMTHRERVMKALNHQEPDRVPIDLGGTTASTFAFESYERLKKHLEMDAETLFIEKSLLGKIMVEEEILERFDVDTRMLPLKPPCKRSELVGIPDSYEDQWGVVWQSIGGGPYYAVKPPFTGQPSIADLSAHRWPDPDDPGLTEGLGARAKELRESTDCAVCLVLPGRVFALGQRLCGFEDWLVNLVANAEFAGALLDKGVEIQSQMLKNILEAVGDNVDVVMCPDDLGMQSAPLISPRLYRKMIKPRHKRLFDAIKSHTEAKLVLHSDGAVAPFIGDFIDVGVDALNPVQTSTAGMEDTKWLKREFGHHISFWGAIDTQHVLPFGTPAEVKEEVLSKIEDLAPGGGYVLASCHCIQPEVPPENVCAMLEAAKEYGRYE